MMEGRIVKATGSWYHVRLDNGEFIDCRLPGKFRLDEEETTNPIAVGDRVSLTMQSDNTATIDDIRDRRNYLIRKATHGRRGTQIIASNVDQVLIIQSLKQPVFKTGFIDRLLVSCEAHEIPAVVVMNKTDLVESKKDSESLDETERLYSKLGYMFLQSSIYDHASVEKLGDIIKGKMSVLTGPSGTGKTSLLNKLIPGQKLKTGDISRFSGKGKHTTTFAQVMTLPEDTYLIDTPGIREFGLVEIQPYELSLFFPEMRSHREYCRFYNCTHHHEPSCAIKKAVENGQIAESRYRSYVNILQSIKQDF